MAGTGGNKLQKFLLVGDSAVGKTSLIQRFVDGGFDEGVNPTIGMDVKVKMVTMDGQNHKLAIWDTAGQERFRTLTSSYYRGAQGIIFVFDVSRRDTFEHVGSWLEEVQRFNTNPDVVLMLVGNKTDLSPREVSTPDALQWAQQHGMLYVEASAKMRDGVQQAFMELLHAVVQSQSAQPPEAAAPAPAAVQIDRGENEPAPYGCC